MRRPHGALVARAEVAPNFRYVRAVAIPFLILGEALVAYLLVRGLARLYQDGYDLTILAAVGLLLAAFVVAGLWLVIAIRIGPTTVYEDGLELRDSALVVGRSFFTWDEFAEARIQVLGHLPTGVTRIILERRGKRKPFTLSSAYGDLRFVEALAGFLESSEAVPTRRE